MNYLAEFDPRQCGGHELRYARSLEWLEPLLLPGAVVYDFGRGSYGGSTGLYGSGAEEWPFNAAVRRLFPVTLHSTGAADLRYPLLLPDAACDGVLAMETVEHMKDREEDVDTFRYSGVRNLLAEAFRLLRPGGWLFLTTPNGSQYGCAWRLLCGHSALWGLDHVREFGYCEIQQFVRDAGFTIERGDALDVWEKLECPPILSNLMDQLRPDLPRGDCTFLVARKPQ